MNTKEELRLKKNIRYWIIFFIVFLALSGITAFPIETELAWIVEHHSFLPAGLQNWLNQLYYAVAETNHKYPFLAYGTDWLAFAHLVIAVAFIGPLRDPVRNVWVIEFGMIACIMVLPLAFIAGPARQIPFYWQLIDCSFGILGIIPLYLCYKQIKTLEKLQAS